MICGSRCDNAGPDPAPHRHAAHALVPQQLGWGLDPARAVPMICAGSGRRAGRASTAELGRRVLGG